MLNSRRSASVGALPAEKKHFVSRVESASGASLDVRCACQFFQCDSLLPERVNPVDSRPGSRQGQHSDEQYHLQRDDLSMHSFEVISHADVAPSVDLSFMERYPELEQTARSRGLVVRSISDATEPDFPGSQGALVAGRRRQLSMGGLSSGSVGRFGDTLSMRSGTSLRRISAGNSKTDLYCADINIPTSMGRTAAGQRSASASRRTSNADLFQASILPGSMQPPQLNLIAATPTPGMSDTAPQFHSHQSSPAPATHDFRNAKPPLSPDYMRPSAANKENQYPGATLPQNRPIDVSRFGCDAVRPSFLLESDLKPQQNPYQPTVSPMDPLAETVAELEQLAQEHNLVNIRDNIQTQTRRPPSIGSEMSAKPLQVDELTKIEIVRDIPVVDIDALVQGEELKAVEHRSRSPRPTRRAKSPPPQPPQAPTPMATLQLPSSRPSSPTPTAPPAATTAPASTPAQQLKRQHTPERQLSPERVSKWQPMSSSTPAIVGAINLQEASPEVKSSYASRFKSMFSPKPQEPRQKSPTPQRSRSPSPFVEQSHSPHREKSPSPSKLLSVFSKGKPQPMSIVNSSASVMKRQEAEPLSVRVTETFSLKVDDMDQYSARPAKPLAPPPHAQTMYSSREDFAASERASVDISDAFAPVVVSAVPRGTISSIGGASFIAGNRNLYSSEIEMPGMSWSQRESEFRHSSSKDPSIVSHGSRPLISVPIQITGSGSQVYRPLRAPSEQRFGLKSKSSFREPRTQSHDRSSRLTSFQEQLYGSSARMTKTVSFNFDERRSRLAEFESVDSPLTQKHKEHSDFLERTYFSRDHEYEPVGMSPAREIASSQAATPAPAQNGSSLQLPMDIDIEQSSAGTTPRTESRTDYEIHTSQVDSSALEELPLQPENRKKSFMASAQDRTRKMQDGLRNQAGKLRTKLRTQPKPKPVSGSPKAKAKERRRFAPEFSKIKMPEIKRPDMSKLKDLKRPEFTKFNKPDMSKFKLPEKFSTLKLRRSKSFKENESELPTESTDSPATTADAAPAPAKKKFEFNFGTYPRAFRKKKPVEEPAPPMESSLGTERLSLSVIPSTETQPSQTSTSSPQGDRGPGPVRSRWADKFSDVSYNDSEGSRYRRYGSELESFDRESSLERRMKEDLEEDTASEAQPQTQMGILSGVADSKQFAEFDEENRAIHEISSQRTREFKRRPMVHQDSDLRSEDSHDAEGWTEKDIQKNKLLRKAELDAEASYYKYHEMQDAHSTASSGKKVVMEQIDDDEFFLRKRGISEDNIQLRQYISDAIREGYELPNALRHVGHPAKPDSEQPEQYGDYDVPPPKPRRLHRNYRPDIEDSQEFQRSEYGDDLSMSQNGSDFLPKRPLRKGRSRSKYSMEGSQEIPLADGGSSIQYFDDDEDYLRPPMHEQATESEQALNNLNYTGDVAATAAKLPAQQSRPQAPRRQKKRTRDDASVEKDADSFINGFGGRSVSNTFLQPQEDVIVYRTEHEYHHQIPLATPDTFTDGTSARTQRSEDERTSRGAESLILDVHAKPELQSKGSAPRTQLEEKFVIDMLESDGYAVVRKEPVPKPTPPARRKKFTRSPGERFATLPSIRGSRGSPPPARPPPPQEYTPSEDSPLPPRRRSAASLEEMSAGLLLKSNYATLPSAQPDREQQPQKEEEDDYEEPGALQRPESPRNNLQSGEVINKMKFRPLPAPPRPPREKRATRGGSGLDSYEDSERVASSSTADSCEQGEFEVEVSTQTDPLPDDFVCEEFEITEDMKVIEPRRSTGGKTTLEDLLRSTQAQEPDEVNSSRVLTEDEQLARGLQRFRDANQRSLSERSRASSQADRSKSLSRPQTPSSAVIIERRVPTPSIEGDATVQAALIVRPISAADLEDEELRREEEELRREGLLSDSSVQSKSDVETAGEEEEHGEVALSDYAASSADLDAAVEQLQQAQLESDYDSKLEDDEVERTLRESEYDEEDEDAGEKYSDHYDEEEGSQGKQESTEQELDEELEKELQEEMEKMLAEYRQAEIRESRAKALAEELPTSEEDHIPSEEDILSDTEQVLSEVEQVLSEAQHALSELEPALSKVEHALSEGKPPQAEKIAVEEVTIRRAVAHEPTEAEVDAKFVATLPTEPATGHSQELLATEEEPEATPLPPPRRKSTTQLEPASSETLTIAEQITPELTPIRALQSPPEAQLPTHLPELEVERLRVHALQAGQIQVSQLHGTQVSADELACKSGQLVVQNINLPPGFIDDIVERVKEQRPSLLTSETQTSRQPSSEPTASDVEKPTKPPRHGKAAESTTATTQSNLDEQTQTEAAMLPLPPPPAVYPSVEYLQSLAPLAFYNLQRSAEAEQAEAASGSAERKAPHKCRRRHVQQEQHQQEHDTDSELDEQLVERPRSRSRRSRTRSATQPLEDYDEDQPKTVVQAGRQFLSVCSLELVNIINQLTHFVRGDVGVEPAQQPRNISALMVLFILITFGVLVFLLTGRQVHTHHWDYFNPPGNEGRQT
ncbi:uncharacterized protein LOC115771091 isoform X3 [Drosophila novamexicana]|uniref:uncharacterized protein LOC115771091 isoform X3 n=1 Tax=Drosophila novamexicana TaxID=47314 RepID=UPI0011E5B86B|nr:uncharacterized protein LOC115771091 isoform X3 [Drosophila novamexicana]